jgi:hypothetical protein
VGGELAFHYRHELADPDLVISVISIHLIRHPRGANPSSPCTQSVIPVLVTGINRGTVLVLIPTTNIG